MTKRTARRHIERTLNVSKLIKLIPQLAGMFDIGAGAHLQCVPLLAVVSERQLRSKKKLKIKQSHAAGMPAWLWCFRANKKKPGTVAGQQTRN